MPLTRVKLWEQHTGEPDQVGVLRQPRGREPLPGKVGARCLRRKGSLARVDSGRWVSLGPIVSRCPSSAKPLPRLRLKPTSHDFAAPDKN